jgi:hypothetical protein
MVRGRMHGYCLRSALCSWHCASIADGIVLSTWVAELVQAGIKGQPFIIDDTLIGTVKTDDCFWEIESVGGKRCDQHRIAPVLAADEWLIHLAAHLQRISNHEGVTATPKRPVLLLGFATKRGGVNLCQVPGGDAAEGEGQGAVGLPAGRGRCAA